MNFEKRCEMFITKIRTWVPKRYSQKELLKLFGLSGNKMARTIFKQVGVETRHLLLPPEKILREEKKVVHLPRLWSPRLWWESVFVFEVSNLGYTKYQRNRFGENYTHLQGYWCPGSVRALDFASGIQGETFIIFVDTNYLIPWSPDFSDTNDIVCAALFGEGLAFVSTSNERKGKNNPMIIDFAFLHDPANFVMYRDGKFTLDRNLAHMVVPLIESVLKYLLTKHDLNISNIAHWIVHTGGARILDEIEKHFLIDLTLPRKILRNYGNLGASSVFFELKEIMESNPRSGDYGVIVSFGPGEEGGFTVAACLLRW